MLTRIEIDGFKTFAKFALDLAPFLVILGPNACGKSNLFDAIRLLSRLAGMDLRGAVQEQRGEPTELFRQLPNGTTSNRMKFAVEVLLDSNVRDPWGTLVEVKYSRLRYEVTLERRRDARDVERLVVVHEKAVPIAGNNDNWREQLRPSASFRKAYFKYGRKTPLLETEERSNGLAFHIHQDGRAGRVRPGDAVEATVLSRITSAEYQHLYALREELRSYRFLQLDPVAMRQPSSTISPERLEPNGGNLATVLARIQRKTATPERPEGALAEIVADLGSLIPGLVGLTVEEDRERRQFVVRLRRESDQGFSASVVSDGTLRVLALLTLLHDPEHRGTICLEEPENGIHPFRIQTLIERLRALLPDAADKVSPGNPPLAQMLLNSHSPVVLTALRDGEMVFADTVLTTDPENRVQAPRTRMRRVLADDQGRLFTTNGTAPITRFEVNRYFSTVRGGA